jgi:tetrahydromethanopterin S-methyltransferase subunit G
VFSVDEDHLGEAVLMETREDRELKKRLKEIDERLQQLKTAAALEVPIITVF